MKKLIPALVMLIVSALVMTSASYAWFTMNKTVTATGMNMTVQAPENLQISLDGSANSYSNTVAFTDTASVLSPASSVDGLKYKAYIPGYTADATLTTLNGVTLLDVANTTVTTPAAGAPIAYGTYTHTDGTSKTYNGYVDYKVYVKSVNAVDNLSCLINIEKYATESTDIFKAVRVALLNDNNTAAAATNYIARVADTATVKVIDSTTVPGTPSLVAEGTNLCKVSTTDNDTSSAIALTANTAKAFVIRVWIEGQDPECVYTNALIAPNFKITLTFSVPTVNN